jgi:hypothetical protein
MAVLANQKILTLDYWKRADQIEKGDWVFDRKGKPSQVTLVQKYTPPNCYELLLNDYLTIGGDEKLRLLVQDEFQRHGERNYKGMRQYESPMGVKSVDDLLQEPLHNEKRHVFNYGIPTALPLDPPAQDLPISPFVFGFWFLNRKPDGKFTIKLDDLEHVKHEFQDAGYKFRKRESLNAIQMTKFNLTPKIELQLAPNIPTRIPINYLMASSQQRIALLRGLIYSKPRRYNARSNAFRITLQNEGLLKQIQWLVESLGLKTHFSYNDIVKNFTLRFKSKLKLHHAQPHLTPKRVLAHRTIVKITKLPQQPCVHIETNGDKGTFLVGEGFISCL